MISRHLANIGRQTVRIPRALAPSRTALIRGSYRSFEAPSVSFAKASTNQLSTGSTAQAASLSSVQVLGLSSEQITRLQPSATALDQRAGLLQALAQANRPLVVSIAAGITSAQLERWLGGNLPVVRAMPNTPALLGAGVATGTGLVFDHHRLPQARREALAHHAREHVGRPARGIRHHQLDGTRGVRILREHGQGQRAQAQGEHGSMEGSFEHVTCLRFFYG